MKRAVVANIRASRRSASTQVAAAKSNDIEAPIVIPKRIQRGPTDILKALAGTISTDYTAPQYKYHDDPFLIPASNYAKRTFALAKENGRKAAKFFLEKYPDSFALNPAVPNVSAFNPPAKVFTEGCECCEEDLNNLVLTARIKDAITVYTNLETKGVAISQQSLVSLLELLSFYNSKEQIDEDLYEERWHQHSSVKESRKTWTDGGLAEKIFDKIEAKDARVYSALLQGLAKHYQTEKAWNVYNEMKSQNLVPSVHSYNYLLQLVLFLREGYEQRWELVVDLLKEMRDYKVTPNIMTFNNVLYICSRLGSAILGKKYALAVMSEMKSVGIEPSLASYYMLLNTFCKNKGPVSYILHDIIKLVEGKEHRVRDPRDVLFFVTAMDVAHNHLVDKELAYKVHSLLEKNHHMIGDAFKESIFYQNFFKLLCHSENIDKVFELYNKYVPNVYTPETSVLNNLIEAIELNKAYKYLPQLWSDIIVFGHAEREKITEPVLRLMAQADIKDEHLIERFCVIANDILTRVDAQNVKIATGFRAPIQWSAQMLQDMITVHLKANDVTSAWTILQKLVNEQQSIVGCPNSESLKAFVSASLEDKKIDWALYTAKFAVELGYNDVVELIHLNADKYNLDEKARKKLESISNSAVLSSEMEEVNSK